jgi:MFS family permease
LTLPVTLRALRYRNFQLYRLTGSSVLLGLVSFSGQIPVFLMAPLGGVVAGRFRRQRTVIATQTASMLLALILAALTLTGAVQIWHVFVLSAPLGVVNAFDIPARQAFFVEMVGRDDRINAIPLNSSMSNASRRIGPAIAGILVDSIGEGWCFFANGASYITVIAGLLLMTVDAHKPVRPPGSPLADIIEGFRFVIGIPPIHQMILLGIVSVTGMPFAVLMPIFAGQILHVGAVKDLGRWVAISAGAFDASLIALAISRSFWLSCAILLPVGFAMMVEMGSSNTLIQTISPDYLRGRVVSVYSMMFMGMAPLGAVLSGVTAARWGAPATVAGGGIVCMAAADCSRTDGRRRASLKRNGWQRGCKVGPEVT